MSDKHKPLIKSTFLKSILMEDTETPLLAVLCPNYEDRSFSVPKHISKYIEYDYNLRDISFMAIGVRSDKGNDMLLENLKATNVNRLCNLMEISEDDVNWIWYPGNFSPFILNSILDKKLKEFSENGQCPDILVDISTLPRTIIFYLCEYIQKYLSKDMFRKVYFAYANPKRYSKIHYAQDVGTLQGMFSGQALELNRNDRVHAVVFPDRTGHEGKLLCDCVGATNIWAESQIYFPIYADKYDESLDIMRANQLLLDTIEYNDHFYSSLEDAVKELDDYFKSECIRMKRQKAQTKDFGKFYKEKYLAAPFDAKIMIVVSYFELMWLKDQLPDLVEIEICHVKGFQYTSVYSIGMGKRHYFELEREACKKQE